MSYNKLCDSNPLFFSTIPFSISFHIIINYYNTIGYDKLCDSSVLTPLGLTPYEGNYEWRVSPNSNKCVNSWIAVIMSNNSDSYDDDSGSSGGGSGGSSSIGRSGNSSNDNDSKSNHKNEINFYYLNKITGHSSWYPPVGWDYSVRNMYVCSYLYVYICMCI